MTTRWAGAEPRPQLPFRRVFERLNRPVPTEAEIVTAYTDGVVTMRSKRAKERYHEAKDLSTYQGVEPGDFVVHGLDIMRGSVGVSDSRGAMSPVCIVCRPRVGVDPRYMAYAMRLQSESGYPKAMARGVRDGGADFRRWETLAELPLPVPSADEQRSIADYLDQETELIDALVGKQKGLITRLRERRDHIIARAVTPEQAHEDEFVSIKHSLQRVDQGISPDTSTGDTSAEFWVLKAGASNRGRFDEYESKPVPPEVAIPNGIEVQRGDLIASRASGSPDLVGSTAMVGTISRRLILSDKNFRLVPKPSTLPRYLYWSLNSPSYRSQVRLAISGADGLANNLPLSSLRRIRVWMPSLNEQQAIADHLDHETAKIDSLIAKVERHIELAKERRSAIISAAVTGRIEIGAA